MDIESVRDAVIAAFDGLEPPLPEQLIGDFELTPERTEWVETFRAKLAGRFWRDLSCEFIEEKYIQHGYYLSANGYQYYLPALIMYGLNSFHADNGLLYSAVLALEPSYPLILSDGHDPHCTEQQSLLTNQQYCAVCSFLGLVFDQHESLRHESSLPLYWGWNRIETPELRSVRAYHQGLRSYTRPEAVDAEIRELCSDIHRAFAETPFPTGELTGDGGGDPDFGEIGLELRDVKWQNAHPLLLAHNNSELSYLSDEGFRYFLPAFMIADLCNDATNADPVFHLTYGLYDPRIDQIDRTALREIVDEDGKHVRWVQVTYEEAVQKLADTAQDRPKGSWRKYTQDRLSTFNARERAAIVRYLEYRARDDFYTVKISQAIEGFWRREGE